MLACFASVWHLNNLINNNGISSLAGVAAANQHDIDVIITDHHLAPEQLPAAYAVVNPNQPGCAFPSKHLAGVGVAFYVL